MHHRQIAATRNSGARAARGERFFFVDADTTVNPAVIRSAFSMMDVRRGGRRSDTIFEGPVPLYARLLLVWLGFFMRLASMTGGAFMFWYREAFHAAGGFDEQEGAEDAAMSAPVTRGPICSPERTAFTSGRRVRAIPWIANAGLVSAHRIRAGESEKPVISGKRLGTFPIARVTKASNTRWRIGFPMALPW